MQAVTARIIFVCACAALFFAAQPCHAACSGKYLSPVFSGLDTTRDLVYGKNIDLTGAMDTLRCDVYQPRGDTAQKRPLLVLIHGGAFITGDKASDDVILRLCAEFGRRGYVTSSINYRLGIESITAPKADYFERANYRAVQDAKAAVRFFRAHATDWRIDTSLIFEGGTSAGAFTAIHHAYLDQSEVWTAIDTSALGNIEGNSGTPGYSSRISAVINCWGAIGDTLWMNRGDAPVISFHGLQDSVVPYDTGSIFWGYGLNILHVYGSAPLYRRAQHVGIYSGLRLFDSTGHGFPAISADMDTTVTMISDFLGAIINCDSGMAGVRFAPVQAPDGRPLWRIRTSENTYAFIRGEPTDHLQMVDCAGRSIPLTFIRNERARILIPVGTFATGMYFIIDKSNKDFISAQVFLRGR